MQDKRQWMRNWLYSGRRQQPGQDMNRGQQAIAGRQGGQSQMHRFLQNRQAPLNTQPRAYTQAPSNAAARGQAAGQFYRNRSQEQSGTSAPAYNTAHPNRPPQGPTGPMQQPATPYQTTVPTGTDASNAVAYANGYRNTNRGGT